MKDNKGLIYSGTLHGLVLFFMILGLPDFFHHQADPEPQAISVEVLPISAKSNVKPQETTPVDHKPPKEETAPKARPPANVQKEEPKEDIAPLPVKPKEAIKKPVPKPPKPTPPKPKKNDDPLKSILEGVQQDAVKEGPKTTKSSPDSGKTHAKSDSYDPGAPLSMSEKDAIKQQIEVNWNPPVGAKDATNLTVLLHIELAQDGSVMSVKFTGDQGRYNSDSFFRAAVDSAKRAVERSSPLKNLNPEKYNVMDGWKEIEMSFNPHDIM